ncbi:MAG: hypothetical protein GON13_01685 [Nanoarchaeota archaeon]|nr:hypothetical protein [Nanoarchaeota archaeon]
MNNDVYIGIKNQSVITSVIAHYYDSVQEFEERLDGLMKLRHEFSITKVGFLDDLMDFVQEYANLKQQIPIVKFKALNYKKIKKKLKKKVKAKKVEIEFKKAKKVAEVLKKESQPKPVRESNDLIRIKNFRKELESLNKQISNLT